MFGLEAELWQSLVLSLNTHRNARRMSPYEVAQALDAAARTGPVKDLASELGFADTSTVRRIMTLARLPETIGSLVVWGNRAGCLSMSVASELSRLEDSTVRQAALLSALQYELSKSEARQLAQLIRRGQSDVDTAVESVLNTRPIIERRELVLGIIVSEKGQQLVKEQGRVEAAKRLKLRLASVCPDVFPKGVQITERTFSIMLGDGDTKKLQACLPDGSLEEAITYLLENSFERT